VLMHHGRAPPPARAPSRRIRVRPRPAARTWRTSRSGR